MPKRTVLLFFRAHIGEVKTKGRFFLQISREWFFVGTSKHKEVVLQDKFFKCVCGVVGCDFQGPILMLGSWWDHSRKIVCFLADMINSFYPFAVYTSNFLTFHSEFEFHFKIDIFPGSTC